MTTEGKYLPIVLDSTGTSFTIVNNGTAAAPCRVTLSPRTNLASIQITGVTDEPVELKNIQSGQIIELDGIHREILIDGELAYDKYNGWEFPRLQPGKNVIKITSADVMGISIEYQPRYI